MTKIAVISDIHGNIDALDAVMADIKDKGCEKLFVLGDYAMAGPQPKEAVEYFMQKINDANIEMIQGNTDLMIADYSQELYEFLKGKAPVMAEALTDDARVLGQDEKVFLKNLPAQKKVTIDDVTFLLVHGSPRRNNEDIMPETPMAELEEMIKDVDAQVVLCGHTHIPCGFQTTSKHTVVNVGSVGRPFTQNPKSCYLTIIVNDGKCVFEHNFVEYNNKAASQKLLERNFTGVEKLAETLLNPEKRHF